MEENMQEKLEEIAMMIIANSGQACTNMTT